MAHSSSASGSMPLQGFTIFQTSLGAPLQFVPALNTPELDAMIDAYVPGQDSIQQKRAAVCVEFFSYAAQTGQTSDLQLFFPVFPAQSFSSASTGSPASLNDSGYGSTFNVSPVAPEMMWDASSFSMTPSTPSSAFAAPSPNRVTKAKPASSRKASSSASSRVSAVSAANDFSHIPGMKILTKDGVDVTNSASRGSKTKEMREHAHLIRLLKACDSCKKKKVRCDPSHKRRGAASSAAQSQPAAAEPVVKAKKPKAASPPITPQSDVSAQQSPSFCMAPAQPSSVETGMDSFHDAFDWEQFLHLDEDTLTMPMDYDFILDPQGFLTPSSGSSASPAQAFTPASASALTTFEAPAPSSAATFQLQDAVQQPHLPYFNPDGHGTDYTDFTLYSPASSFLDEEPQELQSAGPSPSGSLPNTSWSTEANTTAAGHERIGMQDQRQQQREHGAMPANDLANVAFQDVTSPPEPGRDPHDPGYSDSRTLHGSFAFIGRSPVARGNEVASHRSRSPVAGTNIQPRGLRSPSPQHDQQDSAAMSWTAILRPTADSAAHHVIASPSLREQSWYSSLSGPTSRPTVLASPTLASPSTSLSSQGLLSDVGSMPMATAGTEDSAAVRLPSRVTETVAFAGRSSARALSQISPSHAAAVTSSALQDATPDIPTTQPVSNTNTTTTTRPTGRNLQHRQRLTNSSGITLSRSSSKAAKQCLGSDKGQTSGAQVVKTHHVAAPLYTPNPSQSVRTDSVVSPVASRKHAPQHAPRDAPWTAPQLQSPSALLSLPSSTLSSNLTSSVAPSAVALWTVSLPTTRLSDKAPTTGRRSDKAPTTGRQGLVVPIAVLGLVLAFAAQMQAVQQAVLQALSSLWGTDSSILPMLALSLVPMILRQLSSPSSSPLSSPRSYSSLEKQLPTGNGAGEDEGVVDSETRLGLVDRLLNLRCTFSRQLSRRLRRSTTISLS